MVSPLVSPAAVGTVDDVTTGTLSAIRRYPVKSCRGHDVDRLRVDRSGLDRDRHWMLVHPNGDMATARTVPRLVLAVPVLWPDGLSLTAPGLEPLRVPFPAPDAEPMDVRVHAWDTAGLRAGPEADDWFSRLTGVELRLVHLDDLERRRPDPEYSEPEDRVTFADGFPLLLTTEESLGGLNGWIGEGRNAHEGPLSMVRFRPNVVVAGFPPWAEDGWRRVRIGDVEFRAAKPCARCVLTTVDPDTAVKGREPLATLARYRRHGKKLLFGINLIPDNPGGEIRLGDPVRVLGGDPRHQIE